MVAVLYLINQIYGIQKLNYVGMHFMNLRKGFQTWPAPSPASRKAREWPCKLAFFCRIHRATSKPSKFLTIASWGIADFGNLGHSILLLKVLNLEDGEAVLRMKE